MVEEFRTVQTDVLVVGAGGAGGRAAIEAGRSNVNVILLEKGFMGKMGTTVQAGSRALRPKQTNLTVEDRFKFTLGSGCYLNDQDILWVIIKEAYEDGAELAKFAQEMNAGPTENWANALRHEILKYHNINIMEHTIVTRLLTSGGRIVGATALDVRSGDFILFKAKTVILATGGYGNLYTPSECAPMGINGGVYGDGQSLAYHAGVEQVEMEMTCQQTLAGNPRYNLWCRPYGGFIPNGPFLDKDGKVIPGLSTEEIKAMPIGCAPPKPQFLARANVEPTDSAGNYRAELEKRIYLASLKGPVYVDSPTRAKEMAEKGVQLSPALKALHVDPTQIPMNKIVIGTLLGQGGPRINERCETNVLGLYAAGECPGNIYGAYRLNPLMDGILPNGRRAGKYAAEYAKTAEQGEADVDEVERERDRVYGFLKAKPNPISPMELKRKIWELTGKHLFIVRNDKGLREAVKEVEELRKKDLPRMQATDIRRMNINWVDAIEVAFMLDVAEMIARSALFREESRGCQYRDDFPEMDNKSWLCHTLLWKDAGTGEMKLSKAPVVMTKYRPPARVGEDPIPV